MSSPEAEAVLIVAPSGRALAAAARRAGYCPLVIDFFDDLDTRALAVANLMAAVTERGFVASDVIDGLQKLATGRAPIALVYGGGFEDRPELIAELARHFHLAGNSPEVVTRVKDPLSLAHMCRNLGIPHPEISFEAPPDPAQWLIKRAGGGGGLHIAPAVGNTAGPRDYYQRRLAGQPVSALLLDDGREARILGLSEQWTATSSDTPFRFGGAAQPARLDESLAARISEAAATIAASAGLIGLNSIDFLVGDGGFHLLEINPRPGATLDIFADREGLLFAAHLQACRGRLPQQPFTFAAASAAAIVYTPMEIASMPLLDWPDWCRDRQKPGTYLRRNDPVCTVYAEAETTEAARALVEERRTFFQHHLTENASKGAAA